LFSTMQRFLSERAHMGRDQWLVWSSAVSGRIADAWLSDPARLTRARGLCLGFSPYLTLANLASKLNPALHEKHGDRWRFAGFCCFRWRCLLPHARISQFG